MVNRYKENQAKQINQTLDQYLHLLPIADSSEIASELVRGRSQLLKDDLPDLSPTLGSVARTIWSLINSHNVKPEEIAIVTSSSKYKEKISEELSEYAGTAGVKLLDVYGLERAVSESAPQSKIVPRWLPAFIAMTNLPLIEESEKVKTALDFSEILSLLLNKGVDLKKGFDAVEISKAIKEQLKKEGDKSAYLFGHEHQTTLNKKDIDSLVNIFQEFIRDYYTLKSQLGYVDIQDLVDSKQGKSVFDGKRFVFVLNASDMTTMQQELIRVQVEKAGVEAYFLLASEASLYDFKGADSDLKAFKGNNLDFYLNVEETKIKHYVPPNEPKMKKEDVNQNQLYSAAVYFAEQKKGKKVAIVPENNYQIEEIGRILTSQGLEYTISTTLKPNKETLNIIAQEFEEKFENKVPKPEDTELLFKLLFRLFSNDGIAIKTLNITEQNVNQFWELYEKEPFQRFLTDKKVDLKQAIIYAILTSNFYEPFIKPGNNKNTVATVYQLPMEKFDKIFYVSSDAKGQLRSATSLLKEEIGKLYHIQQRSEEQKRQDTLKVLENIAGEVIIINGTSKAKSRPEIPRSKDLIQGEGFEIINTYDFVFNYFKNLRVVSFSMLKDIKKPAEFLIREILGYKEYSEPAEIGSKMHKIFMLSNENKLSKKERKALKRNGNVVFLSNKEEIDSIIKRAGYKYVPGSAEQNIEIGFDELTKVFDKIPKAIPKTLKGKGVPDAIFEKQEGDRTRYLIIDYKTGASKDKEEEYAAQLLFYKLLFSLKNNIPIENIETAVAYVGLRGTLDYKSAAKYELHWITPEEEDNAKDFLGKRVSELIAYVSNPQAFTTKLKSLKAFFDLCRS